jgi:hypothetical protein
MCYRKEWKGRPLSIRILGVPYACRRERKCTIRWDLYVEKHEVVLEKSLLRLAGHLEDVGKILVRALKGGHKVSVSGNGGSATQASHFAGDLVGVWGRLGPRCLPWRVRAIRES